MKPAVRDVGSTGGTIMRYARALASGGPLSTITVASGLVIVALVLYPLANLVGGLFFAKGRLSLAAFEQTIAEPDLVTILINTVAFVFLSGFAALAIGSLLAWLSERTNASLGWATNVLPLVPLFLPSLASAIGWVLLCAPRAGLVNVVLRAATGSTADTGPIDIFTFPGMIFVATIQLVPYSYLAVSSALRNLDASLEEASRMSGAGVLRTLAKVSMPIVTPAVVSGAVLIIMSGLTLFSIPAILGPTAHVTVLSTLLYKLVQSVFPPRMGEAIVLSVLALSVIQILIWAQMTLGARRFQTVGTQGLRRVRVPIGGLRAPARALIVFYFLAAAVLPLLALVIVSLEGFWTPNISLAMLTLDNYRKVLSLNSSLQTMLALRNSVLLGSGVALIDLTIAVVLAYHLSRSRGFLTRALDVIATLPSTVPHIVMGVAFLLAFSQPPIVLYGTVGLIFLAYIAMAMPQAMQFAKSTFGQVSPELAEASRVFGASEARTFLRILVPLVLPGAIAGGIVVAVHTLNETNASVLLATAHSVVVGPTLYDLWNNSSVAPVAAFATAICVVDAALALASIYAGRLLSVGRGS